MVAKVEGAKTRYRNNKDTAEQSTPKFNNAKLTNYKKMIFKFAVAVPANSLLCILSHRIAPESTLNSSNISGQKGTSNRAFKICLVTLSIVKNNNKSITVGKAVNALMKSIHVIEGDANKVK